MKDEFGGAIGLSYVGLAPKCYSVQTGDDVIKKCKGTSRSVVKKELSHKDYWDVLGGSEPGKALKHFNTSLRSFGHVNTTLRQMKVSLSPIDTKRWILDDGVSSLAYGHWRVEEPRRAAAKMRTALEDAMHLKTMGELGLL